jgi:LacI family transcriptional regulator
MAERSITMLLEEISTKRPPTGTRALYEPTLVVRQSCRAIG